MPRIARIVLQGVPYHFTQWGSARRQVFFDDRDYELYLDLLHERGRIAELRVLPYCLMPDHGCSDAGRETGYDVAMGARMGVSVEEYLHTSFPDLDREYRDGEIVERALPDYLHGKVQALLVAMFIGLRDRVPVFPCVETRMKVRTGLYLIPDVAVFYREEPEGIPENPPLMAIEVLSTDDRWAAVREKLEEYRRWGVAHVWLVDPHSRRLYTCDAGLNEVGKLAVPELGMEVTPAQIFG